MRLSRVTVKDETLTHQLIISGGTNTAQNVSCNCLREPGRHEKAGRLWHKPMGRSKNMSETRALYNNPENHNAPFSKEDELRG